MKKQLLLFIACLFTSLISYGQTTVYGLIKNEKNIPQPSVSIILKNLKGDSILQYTYSDDTGKFSLEIKQKGKFTVSFSSLGYKKKSEIIEITAKTDELEINTILEETPVELDEVIIMAERPIVVKKDTVVFNAKYFLKGNEQVVEDLLKNIPGLSVESDGTIKVGGKIIEKIMVDYDDFFGKGYKMLSKNMPPSPIEKVEILKRYSNNKLLKGIEKSDKVALNLVLKEDAKRVWFGNFKLGYGLLSKNRYSVQSNLMNFGKKNKYYFLTNFNNIGIDATGDIWDLIQPNNYGESADIGDNQKVSSLLDLGLYSPSFSESRTLFNNTKLVSLNAIFNPTKKLKIKPMVFLNWDENDFFKNTIDEFYLNGASFTNTENHQLTKKKAIGFGKLEIYYDISKTKSLKSVTKFNNYQENTRSNLTFNTDQTTESLKSNTDLFDQKIKFTNKFKKNKVLLITGRLISESNPQNYTVNSFFYQNLFPSSQADNVEQSIKNNMEFAGVVAELFDRKTNGDLLEINMGNQYRKDKLLSSFLLKKNADIVNQPINYQNNTNYINNDLFLKTSYHLKINKLSLVGKVGFHQLYNQLEQATVAKTTSFYINPKFGFDWIINSTNKMSAYYSFNTTNAEVLDVYDNYTVSDFRSFVKGTGKFNQLTASSVTWNYQLGNWGDKFFANAFVLYNKNYDFYSSSSTIQQNYSLTERTIIKDRELLNVSLDIDRFLKGISSNFKIKLGYSKSNYKNVVNSVLQNVVATNYSYEFQLRSGLRGIFNYHIGTSWSTNTINTSFKNSFTNNTSFLDLSFVFNQHFNFDMQSERYVFGSLDTNNTYYFADFNARYNLKNKKVTFTLSGKNLFNTEVFKDFSISDIGTSTTEYRLLPRYVLLSIAYRF